MPSRLTYRVERIEVTFGGAAPGSFRVFATRTRNYVSRTGLIDLHSHRLGYCEHMNKSVQGYRRLAD